MPPLSRSAVPLLRTVGGQQHARVEHHDEYEVEQGRGATEELRNYDNEDDIYGSPVSSGDEAPSLVKKAASPPPPPPPPPTTRTHAKPTKSLSSKTVDPNPEPPKRKSERIARP